MAKYLSPEVTPSAYSREPDGARRAVWHIGKGITDFKVPQYFSGQTCKQIADDVLNRTGKKYKPGSEVD